VKLTQGQFDALVSFAYNLGARSLSTLCTSNVAIRFSCLMAAIYRRNDLCYSDKNYLNDQDKDRESTDA